MQKVGGLKEKLENGEVKLKNGMSYLEVKYTLLLQYIQYLQAYLLFKAEGRKGLSQHPLLKRLI